MSQRSPFYEALSVLDQTFLALESPNSYMHVAATVIVDGERLRGPQPLSTVKLLKDYIMSRLPLIPAYRRRLASIPLENRSVWVDDRDFRIDNHVKSSSLPPPGGPRQLQRRCEELLERPLDRGRPLWEIWVIDGLGGGKLALLCKVHHCLVDGLAGVELMTALFQLSPERSIAPVPRWVARPVPTETEMLRDEIRRRLRRSLTLLSKLPAVVSDPAATAQRVGDRLSGLIEFLRSGMQAGMDTQLNAPIGPHRRVAFVECALAEVKAVKAALGGTINDVVLATVHGAVRQLLARRGGIEAGGEFRVAVPVNTLDAAGRSGRLGNHVWAWIIDLPVRESDPVRALQLIGEQTRQLKETAQASSGTILTEAVEWTTARLVPLGAQLVNRAQPNLVVTNVPGPPLPLFVLDAPVEAIYPHVPLFERQGLGIALFSYAGKLFWGLTGDWDLLSDIELIAQDIRSSFETLVAAAAARGQPSVKVAETRKRTTRRGPPQTARLNGQPATRIG